MDRFKDACFRRNVAGVSMVEFFWGLGFPIVLESTFLQLFLKQLGASSLAIGLVPSFFVAGISCFPLFASYISRNYRHKRPLVAILHLGCALFVFIFGLILSMVDDSGGVLPIFFLCYGLFSICLGLTIPVWLNYMVRIFSEARTVPGLGYMMLAQNIGKVISSFFILKVVERYAFSLQSSAWVFMITGLLFTVGSLSFFTTREIADPDGDSPDTSSFFDHTKALFGEILKNHRFLVFLAADLDFVVILTVMSFYATYATGFYQVPPSVAAGGFVACIYGGSITVNIFLGAMNLLSLKQKFILSKCVTLVMLSLLICFPGQLTFFLISYMLGFSRAIRNMVYAPSIKRLSGKDDVTAYFSLAPVLTLPITAGFPLLFGKLLDALAFMAEDSFKLLFGAAFVFVLVTLYFSVKTDYSAGKAAPS